MAATEVKRPFNHPGWVYEEKVDGWRVLAYKDAAGVRAPRRAGWCGGTVPKLSRCRARHGWCIVSPYRACSSVG